MISNVAASSFSICPSHIQLSTNFFSLLLWDPSRNNSRWCKSQGQISSEKAMIKLLTRAACHCRWLDAISLQMACQRWPSRIAIFQRFYPIHPSVNPRSGALWLYLAGSSYYNFITAWEMVTLNLRVKHFQGRGGEAFGEAFHFDAVVHVQVHGQYV